VTLPEAPVQDLPPLAPRWARTAGKAQGDLLLADVLHAAHLQGLSLTVRSAGARS
jgi:hypothetical protein